VGLPDGEQAEDAISTVSINKYISTQKSFSNIYLTTTMNSHMVDY